MTGMLERSTIRAIAWRIMPLLLLGYLIAYIDRINIGFAAIPLRRDLGFSNTIFGFGAGLFFVGYFLFDVPSNLMLERVGARRWMSRIMICWGILSACMVFVRGQTGFYFLRFFLGIGEAGFFPGVIFLIVTWFPRAYRTKLMALFAAGIPLSSVIGAPLSTLLLKLNGSMGFPDWQWMFMLEALPAVVVGMALYIWLPDRPEEAAWLDAEQKTWLADAMASEEVARAPSRIADTIKSFYDPRVLALSLTLFVNTAASIGLAVFLPQIMAHMGARGMAVGWLTTLPPLAGLLGLYVLGINAKRFGDRAMLLSSLFISVAGLACAAKFGAGGASPIGLAALAIAGFGIFGLKGPFWALCPTVLAAGTAAGGIAWINSLGNLGGWAGPSMIGWLSDHMGGYESGMYGLAAGQIVAALLVWRLLPGRAASEKTTTTSG